MLVINDRAAGDLPGLPSDYRRQNLKHQLNAPCILTERLGRGEIKENQHDRWRLTARSTCLICVASTLTQLDQVCGSIILRGAVH